MKNPTLWIIIVALLIIGGSLWYKKSQSENETNAAPTTNPNDIVLFFGNTCPHCKIVEEFLQENKVDEKIKFYRKEVYDDKKNAEELTERAKTCGLNIQEIGVPFLWDGKNCFQGQVEVINFFKEKTGIK